MFNCTNCDKICKTKAGLTKHLKVCSTSSHNNICEYCEENFSNSYTLKRHIEEKRCSKYISNLETKYNEIKLQLEICETKLKEKEEYIKKIESNSEDWKKQAFNVTENNTTLSHKVGNRIINNHTTNNNILLPCLNNNQLGKYIKGVRVDKLTSVTNYCYQLTSDNKLENDAYVTNMRNRTLIYNDNGSEFQDVGCKQLSKNIADHPETKTKQVELKGHIQMLENQNNYDNSESTKVIIKQMKEVCNVMDKAEVLEKEIPKHLQSINSVSKFVLNNYLNKIVKDVKKDAYSLLFCNSIDILLSNHMKNKEKLIVLDDNGKEHILSKKDIIYIINHLYTECISLKAPLFDYEIRALQEIKEQVIENPNLNLFETSLENLQNNLKIFSNINEEQTYLEFVINNIIDYN